MIIRKKDSFIKYENGSWNALFHFNFQGQEKSGEIFKGYSNLFAFSDDKFSNDFEFPKHEHQMFVVGTYVIEGKIEHRDSTSKKANILTTGDFQFTDTAKGAWHSETPLSENVHSIQMWLFPKRVSENPSYTIFRSEMYKEDGSYFINPSNINSETKIAVLDLDKNMTLGDLDRNLYIYVIEGEIKFGKTKVDKQEVLILENEVVELKVDKKTKLLILSLE